MTTLDAVPRAVADSKVTMALRGGARPGAGRKSAYPRKDLAHPFGMDFTPAGRQLLDQIRARTGLSRDDILAHLVDRHLTRLRFDGTHGCAYPGKLAANVLRIRLPRDLGDRLRDARRRTGKSYSDLGEALVTIYGSTTSDYPSLPHATARRPARRRARRRQR